MAISTKPPSGMRDFLPLDVARRHYVMGKIKKAYEAHGFLPLETSALERAEVLSGKYGDEGDKLIFKVLKRGKKLPKLSEDTDPKSLSDMALRYDLTVPLARVVAARHGELPKFFKRYQMQPVWRADRPQKGRFREFYQCDVDFAGTTSLLAEATVIGAVTDALAALEFHNFTIRLNDRRILSGLMEVAGIAEDKQGSTLVIIDKLDKIGEDGVDRELRALGLDDHAMAGLAPALRSTSKDAQAARAALEALVSHFEGRSEQGSAGVQALLELLALIEAAPIAAGQLCFDASLARGLSYYTGPIFEIEVEGLSGSMGGGGRYDGLVGMFRGTQIPSVGFALGFERILVVMEERGMFPDLQLGSETMLAWLDAEAQGAGLSLCQDIRKAGVSVELYPEKAKLGKQFQYAESQGTRFVLLYGKTEVEREVVLVKDLAASEQTEVPRADLPGYLATQLKG